MSDLCLHGGVAYDDVKVGCDLFLEAFKKNIGAIVGMVNGYVRS